MSKKKTTAKKPSAKAPGKRKTGRAKARGSSPNLNPNQMAYVAARLKGKTPYNALVEAGYNPGNRRSGQAMAARIESRLQSRPELLAALEAAGLSPELVADAVLDGLMTGEPQQQAAILKAVGKWCGWEKVEVSVNDPLAGLAHQDRQAVADGIRTEIERRRAARGGGPAGRGR